MDGDGWDRIDDLKADLVKFYEGGVSLQYLDDMPLDDLSKLSERANRQAQKMKQK